MNSSHRRAIKIAVRIAQNLTIQQGQGENEIADRIRQELKKHRAKPSFRTIVASGKRSAKPHGYATGKIIRERELVVVDFGALYNGWRSDITRTFIVGKPSLKQLKIYTIVKQSQLAALKAVKAGVECRAVDRAARDYIARRGFGKYFIHTTGHGIGRKVHAAPKISKNNRRRLKAGQIITIEPGIYIKGWGGVRIEDMFEVTRRGVKALTWK